MADLPPSSSDSLKPSATPSASAFREPKSQHTSPWIHLALFLGTFASMVIVYSGVSEGPLKTRAIEGAEFAGTLALILLFHEFGHYFAARIHKVDTSLPYFIPFPIPGVSLLGTFGAVIRMRGTIPNRRALLDIGASGPLAGLCIAIPAYFYGASHSSFVPMVGSDGMELGDSIALKLLDHFAQPVTPPGMELSLNPIAFAAWGGMLVTMINLFPVSQLDGGHVAYSILGPRQNKIGLVVHRAMLGFFFASVVAYCVRDVRVGIGLYRFGTHVTNSMFWLVWYHVLIVLGSTTATDAALEALPNRMSVRTRISGLIGIFCLLWLGTEHDAPPFFWVAFTAGLVLFTLLDFRGGLFDDHKLLDHPDVGAPDLGIVRKVIAVVTLVWFVLLLMPAPITM
ncbi:MAG TPA: site-2 protease family protein [Polyangiaceae bacterium]